MSEDLGVLWRSQPEERLQINVQEFVNRRSRELESTTRGEIIGSIGAAVLLVAVIGWLFAFAIDRLQRAGLVLVFAWACGTLYWFRDRIFTRGGSRQSAVASTCLDYYRRQLVLRRDHLRNAWVWHGPLALACSLLVVSFLGKALPGYQRLLSLAPFVALFVFWVGSGIRRRRSEANELQREIDDMGLPI